MSVAIHPTDKVVVTGDLQGRIDQWLVLGDCVAPASVIETVDRANAQHTALPALFDHPSGFPAQDELLTPVLKERKMSIYRRWA